MRGALLLLATGCNSILGVTSIQLGDGGAPPGDTRAADGAALDASMCVQGSLITACAPTPLVANVALPSGTFDTDTDSLCATQSQLGGPDVCVIGGTAVSLAASTELNAVGSRPLVIVALDRIELAGTISVSAATSAGAGADSGGCDAAGAGSDSKMIPGGGGGGGFGTAGAVGGGNQIGGAGGAADVPSFVRGGCSGGAGGNYLGGTLEPAAPGGVAGGGVYLLAANTLTIEGTGGVFANGGGGTGGSPNGPGGGGGGGGASGGLVGLDAITLVVNGPVLATGGGGGAGGESAGSGGDGGVGTVDGGKGGVAVSSAGGGGSGGDTRAPSTGTGASINTGEGGGGGAVGVIWIHASTKTLGSTMIPQGTIAP